MSQPDPTLGLRRATPPPYYGEASDSEDEQWHDAADAPTNDDNNIEVPASSRRPPSPFDPESQEESLKKALEEANELKTRGNDLFREGKWQRALEVYLEGLGVLPPLPQRQNNAKGKGKARARDDDEGAASEDGPRVDVPGSPTPSEVHEAEASPDMRPITLMEQQCAVLRSIFNSNIAACHVKLDDHKMAVKFCTDSLLDGPTYAKALQRRASSNEVLGTWSSLSSAEQDYKLLLDTLPPNSPLRPSIRRSLDALPPRIQRAQKAETDEMLDKLKGLGNSVLGRFGLSTDNFQFTPNGQGGYSMNFVR